MLSMIGIALNGLVLQSFTGYIMTSILSDTLRLLKSQNIPSLLVRFLSWISYLQVVFEPRFYWFVSIASPTKRE